MPVRSSSSCHSWQEIFGFLFWTPEHDFQTGIVNIFCPFGAVKVAIGLVTVLLPIIRLVKKFRHWHDSTHLSRLRYRTVSKRCFCQTSIGTFSTKWKIGALMFMPSLFE